MKKAWEVIGSAEFDKPGKVTIEHRCGATAHATPFELCSEADQKRCCHPLAPKVELIKCPECGRSWRSIHV